MSLHLLLLKVSMVELHVPVQDEQTDESLNELGIPFLIN